jgi:hypothetical protein
MHHGFGKDHSQLRIVGRSVKSVLISTR